MNLTRTRILGLTVFLLLLAPGLAQEATVQISLAEFLKLTSQALAPDNSDRSPIPYMFSQGDYRLSEEGDWIRVESQISIQVYESGWVEIPLLPSDVLIESASLDHKDVTLYNKDGQHTFCLKSDGRHTLELAYYLKQDRSGSTRSVPFRSPTTSVTNLKLVLQGNGLKVNSTPSIPLQAMKTTGRTVVEGTVPAGAGVVTLSWVPLRADPGLHGKTSQEKARLYARIYALVTPGEREVRTLMKIDYTILHNEVSTVQFRVPEGIEIDKVECPGLEDWELSKQRVLTLKLAEPASGSLSMTLTLERALKETEGPWDVPLVEVQGTERLKASVGLASTQGLELEPVDLKQVRAIDVRELPTELSTMNSAPLLLAYEYHQQPQRITLKTRRGEQVPTLEGTVDLAQGATLVTPDGKVCTAFTFDLKNTTKQHLVLSLPEGSQIWSSFVDDKPVKPVRSEEGLKIPLPADSGTRTISVRLVYIQEGLERGWFGSAGYQAPKVDLPVSLLNWTLYLPDDREVIGLGGSMSEGLASHTQPPVQDQSKKPDTGYFDQPQNASSEAQMELGAGRLRVDNEKMSQMLQETSRGAFPVEVQIPESGQAVAFHQLLLTGETASIEVRYLSSGLISAIPLVVLICLLAMAPWLRKQTLRQIEKRRQADVEV